jgi:endonuclease G
MFRNQLDQLRALTPDLDDRLARARARLREAAEAEAMAESPIGLEAAPPPEAMPEMPADAAMAEAIVLAELRPAYFLSDTAIDLVDAVEADAGLLALVKARHDALAALSRGVGRIDLVNHFTHTYGGTGFLIDDDLVVTNRHVAEMFAERLWSGGYRWKRGRMGEMIEARLDYRRHHRSDDRLRAEVTEVLYIAREPEPDFALLRVARAADAPKLALLGGGPTPAAHTPVAVVGYPAADGTRNDRAIMDRIFRGIYEVKRLAPGYVSETLDGNLVFLSDYSSLGGNSGSPVVALDDDKVLGLHFAGKFMENNYAVAADVVEAARRAVIRVHPSAAVPPPENPVSPAGAFGGRRGYDPDFLGEGDLSVPLPALGPWEADAAPVAGVPDAVLRYHNFSVVQSVSRRLPIFTAVNIDGAQSRVLKRRGTWKLDGRLAADHQVGNELYYDNPFDRGHMVRRRDPGWGPDAEAAERDTFHYTNSAPQHANLNQKDWVGLEDYVLGAAETRGFRVSVFTGPVLHEGDLRLKGRPEVADVRIPEEFWKVVVMVNDDTGDLTATAYVLSQGRMIRRLVEAAFVYGQYMTYQVQVARVAAETGLDFGRLPEADPLGAELTEGAPFAAVAREVHGPDSLVLRPPRMS